MASTPRKRVRDYSAERARRNAEARRWGFTSLDQMSKARRRGEFPTAARLRADPSLGFQARTRLAEKARETFDASGPGRAKTPAYVEREGPRTGRNAKLHDREAQEWSDAHSQQKSTRFNPRWSAARKERYYQTFVRPWGKKRTDEQLNAYYDWQLEYEPTFTETEDPYV